MPLYEGKRIHGLHATVPLYEGKHIHGLHATVPLYEGKRIHGLNATLCLYMKGTHTWTTRNCAVKTISQYAN